MAGFLPADRTECRDVCRSIVPAGTFVHATESSECRCNFCPKDLMNSIFRPDRMKRFLKYTGCKDIYSLFRMHPDSRLFYCG